MKVLFNLIGGYFAGYIADNFGRRKALLYTTFFLFIMELTSTFVDQFIVFLIVMAMISFMLGITTFACMSYLIEWLPMKNRSMILSCSQLYPLGMIILNSFALLTIVDNEMIYWRWLQRCLSFLNLLCFFILKAFCYESPKFFISRQKFNESFFILDKVGK